jgi:hypothetical protein
MVVNEQITTSIIYFPELAHYLGVFSAKRQYISSVSINRPYIGLIVYIKAKNSMDCLMNGR